jgi:hypothetical protein
MAIGLAAFVAAPSTVLSAGRDDGPRLKVCIDKGFISSIVAHDDHTIVVRQGPRAWRFTTNVCPHLGDPLPRISTYVRGGDSICGPHDVRLMVSDSADRNPVPCFVQSIEPISNAEARALERRKR